MPKILLFDIETAPTLALVWRMWQENISPEAIEKDWFIISWSAKWLFDNEVLGKVLTPKEAKEGNDSRIIGKIWNLFDEADIVIAHNGEQFDIPKLNTRFVLDGLTPPSPYKTIDTLKEARKHFSFSHNKLDYLAASLLGGKHKIKTDFSLWRNCVEGDRESLEKMLEYNKKDVLLLEEVYLKLRPWMKSHPNLNLYMDGKHCPYCGSSDYKEKGKYRTQVNSYMSFRCDSCGGISRATKSSIVAIAK